MKFFKFKKSGWMLGFSFAALTVIGSGVLYNSLKTEDPNRTPQSKTRAAFHALAKLFKKDKPERLNWDNTHIPQDIDWNRRDLREYSFKRADMQGRSMQGSAFASEKLEGAMLLNANLQNITVHLTKDVENTQFRSSILIGARFIGSRSETGDLPQAVNINFARSSMQKSEFKNIIFKTVHGKEYRYDGGRTSAQIKSGYRPYVVNPNITDLAGVKAWEAKFYNVEFRSVNAIDADFRHAEFENVTIRSKDYSKQEWLPETDGNFFRALFDGAKFKNTLIEGGGFQRADFRNVETLPEFKSVLIDEYTLFDDKWKEAVQQHTVIDEDSLKWILTWKPN